MKTTSTTTSCDCCGARVEGAKHVLLCDRCLDARLAELELPCDGARKRTSAQGLRSFSSAGRRTGSSLAGGWSGALAVGAVLHAVA